MLQQKPKIEESPDAVDFEFKQGGIEFRGVSFGHAQETQTNETGLPEDAELEQKGDAEIQYLFKDLNLKIEPGTTNAIVGPSGFGKTTMLHLLYRIFDPLNGQVLIDGQDVKDLKFESFRKYISVVPQNGILFNDTIEFNLRYGNQEATQDEIEKVAKQCSIHERIMTMPEGYQTQVGDLGSKLSGGERQRILIARGLLKKDAQIYLFDEATSNLDAHTE